MGRPLRRGLRPRASGRAPFVPGLCRKSIIYGIRGRHIRNRIKLTFTPMPARIQAVMAPLSGAPGGRASRRRKHRDLRDVLPPGHIGPLSFSLYECESAAKKSFPDRLCPLATAGFTRTVSLKNSKRYERKHGHTRSGIASRPNRLHAPAAAGP